MLSSLMTGPGAVEYAAAVESAAVGEYAAAGDFAAAEKEKVPEDPQPDVFWVLLKKKKKLNPLY